MSQIKLHTSLETIGFYSDNEIAYGYGNSVEVTAYKQGSEIVVKVGDNFFTLSQLKDFVKEASEFDAMLSKQ